ncbi:MAG: metallopeptidase family protein [Deltaproteobacteria bacterium]|nr:metallopeptidase family protein [Deltaproteobacteria bacterium]
MSRTDRMQADLERGFEALEEGRLEDAAANLERCKRIDRKHPDVITLAAAVADATGDTVEALAQYGALSELRPDDPMPRICMARIQLKDEEDPDAALETLEAVFDFIDEEADLVEAIYVKTEALLARGEPQAARAALAELATSVIEDPDLALDLGELALAAEDPPRALTWIETARKLMREADAPADDKRAFEADALHVIGRVHEATEDPAKMIAAWQQVRVLDLESPPGGLSVTEEELEQIALDTLAELPPEIRARLEKVPILIDDVASEALVAEGLDPRALGVFQGTAMPDAGSAVPAVTTILLFKRSLERFATDEDHLAEEIRITVLHETAHYFGLDEDDLVKLGLD